MQKDETQARKTSETKWTWFLFSLKGRINRKQYWVFNVIILAGWTIIQFLTPGTHDLEEISKPQFMYAVWITWPQLAVHAKRWHDVNKSALWILIECTVFLPLPLFISIAGPVWAFIQNGFIPGTPGPNRFGPDPLKENK